MSGLSKKEKQMAHSKWIDEIAKTETLIGIQEHFVKHANEIYNTKDPNLWAASMENLLEIYVSLLDLKYEVDHKIARLARHHVKNKRKGPLPPKEIRLEDWVKKEILEEYK